MGFGLKGTLTSGALLLAVLGACARPQVFGLRHDRAFTYQSLDSGSIAVGGVTWIIGDAAPSPPMRAQFESLLATSLKEVYPHLAVVSAGAVVTAIGDSLHGALLEGYRRVGELDSAALHEVSARLPKSRYVVFARIEGDNTDSAETVTQDSAEKKLKVERIVLSRSRTITVEFHVHDGLLVRSVWTGQLMKSDTTSKTYIEPRGFVASLVTAIVRGSHKYPSPPTRMKVLRLLFEDFAESLPQPPKRRG
jgi:hypothetical protein